MAKSKLGAITRRNYIAHNHIGVRRIAWLSPYREKEIVPTSDDLEKIRSYIKNPTHSGIWKLGINLVKKSEIVTDINRILEVVSRDRFVSRRLRYDRLSHLPEMSLIFTLFKFLIEDHKNEKEWRQPYYDYEIQRIFLSLSEAKNQKILQTFTEKYSESIKFFKNNLYKKGLDVNLISDKALSVKSGAYFFEDEDEGANLISKIPYDCVLVSTSREPLEKILTFSDLVKITSSTKLIPVFSPEEEVFSSYIGYLRFSSRYLFRDKSVVGVIENAISEYEDENYNHSVSIVGLGAEELLIEIYENYFRDSAPKKYTLKQLYELIHDNIKTFLRPNLVPQNSSSIYTNIKNLIEKKEGAIQKIEILKTLRLAMNIIDGNRKYLETEVNNLRSPGIRDSVFPRTLRGNIEELIANRNKVSHKSRISADYYDTIRTIYCYITLVLWWDEDKECIDWTQDQGEILKQSLERNSGQASDLPEGELTD